MNKVFYDLCNTEYLLQGRITANSDTAVTLYGNHRHFLLKERRMKSGETIDVKFAVAIRDADFQKQESYRDSALSITLKGDCAGEFTIAEKPCKTVYTLGDSTVCNQVYDSDTPMGHCGGWGQALPLFLGDKAAVSNHAEQGTHTKDCLDCHFKPVMRQIKKGDIVLVQFGHNDQKQPWMEPFGLYMDNIVALGENVKSKGGEFVVCTPINRLIYINGQLNDYLDMWRDGAKKAAEKLGVMCIDLHTYTGNIFKSLGDEAEKLFYHSPELDRTHTNDCGAVQVASYVSEQLIQGGKI